MMRKFVKINLTLVVLAAVSTLVNGVPTSVLAGAKDTKLNNPKVKRSSLSTSPQSSSSAASSSIESLSNHKMDMENSPIAGKSEISLGNTHRQNVGLTEVKSTPQKRGINSQLMYGDIFNTMPAVGAVGNAPRNGVWSDELDPAVVYPDIQDFEDYQRGTYNVKPYDNIRDILSQEPIALPLQYPYRYYGDRRKRSNSRAMDARQRSESQLSPADLLALVALVEAGQRSRFENENEDNYGDYPRSYYREYDPQAVEENNDDLFVDPSNYAASPYSYDPYPLYDNVKLTKPMQRYNSKRFMVSKKKRSLGPYANDVSDHAASKLNGRFPSHFMSGKAPKRFQTAF